MRYRSPHAPAIAVTACLCLPARRDCARRGVAQLQLHVEAEPMPAREARPRPDLLPALGMGDGALPERAPARAVPGNVTDIFCVPVPWLSAAVVDLVRGFCGGSCRVVASDEPLSPSGTGLGGLYLCHLWPSGHAALITATRSSSHSYYVSACASLTLTEKPEVSRDGPSLLTSNCTQLLKFYSDIRAAADRTRPCTALTPSLP